MKGVEFIYNTLIQRKKFIESEIQRLTQDLANLPEGKIIVTKNGSTDKWYLRKDNVTSYLPKENMLLAQQLAYKKYVLLQLKQYNYELNAINSPVKPMEHTNASLEKLLSNPLYQKLLEPYNIYSPQEYVKWADSPYEKNPHYPEHLVHESVRGIMMRSKSESLIASRLAYYHIPFRYEARLELPNNPTLEIYPDFTVIKPATGQLCIFEHFGMMDISSYASDFSRKVVTYSDNGYILGHNFIATYETGDNPPAVPMIDRLIECYLM